MEGDTKASEMCHLCQDFQLNVGHETKWCPNSSCKKCGQTGHTKIGCTFGLENLPLPNEIVLKILSYLDIVDLRNCVQVSKRLRSICFDKSLLYEKALKYRNLKYGTIQCPLCQNGFELLENMVKHANNVHDTRIYSKKIGRWIISDSDDTVKVEDCEMESVRETPQITKFCYSCQDFQSNVGHETQWCPSR